MVRGKMLVIALGVTSLAIVTIAQPCNLTILTNVHFRSMTEMAQEKEYPDVIVFENEYIQLWSVPNRGRIIFDLIYKPTGHSQLFSERHPLPLRFRKLYTFEFGGIYCSFPWHKRDNVPLPLEVEAIEHQETCTLFMAVEDPETHIVVAPTLSISSSSAECLIEITLSNTTTKEQKVDFGLVICTRPGGQATTNTQILLPIHSVKVEQSDGDWMGKAGSEIEWPAPWSRWGNFQGPGSFSFALGALGTPEITVYNPDTREMLRLHWLLEDWWTSCEIFSWGPNYHTVMGAFDGFRIEIKAENMLLAPSVQQSLHLYIGVTQQ